MKGWGGGGVYRVMPRFRSDSKTTIRLVFFYQNLSAGLTYFKSFHESRVVTAYTI